MRFSELFAPTLKESPAEAEIVSHQLLVRAGMIRKVAAGIYTFLPLGYRVLKKVEQIIREEMNRIGAQELVMPALQPAEIWQQSGRWYEYGPEMWRIKDRNDRDFCLGPTHEELITDLVKKEVRSYRQLPLTLYQIQVKFRDEIRPRFGLMRAREFLMKDAYSFNADISDLEESYQAMHSAYSRFVERCGLEYRAVEAATGLIGGKVSQEFMVLANSGEETIYYCDKCDYAASQAVAATKLPDPSTEETKPRELVKTPGEKSVEQVTRFLNVTADRLVKTLIFKHDDELTAVLIRGDREVNEEKLASALGTANLRLLGDGEWKEYPHLVPGFVGPVDLSGLRVIADNEVSVMRNFVVGANQPDAHLINVNVENDFRVDEWADVKIVSAGDPCPRCDGVLLSTKGIEVGHIFQLGTKYSESLGAKFIDEHGKLKPYIMGSYGIGISRMVAAAIEQNNDAAGIIWPISIAPFEAVILLLSNDDPRQRDVAEQLYNDLVGLGHEVLLDDRVETAGRKFADADLIGFPVQVIVGAKALEKGKVEVKLRRTGERQEFPISELSANVHSIIQQLFTQLPQ